MGLITPGPVVNHRRVHRLPRGRATPVRSWPPSPSSPRSTRRSGARPLVPATTATTRRSVAFVSAPPRPRQVPCPAQSVVLTPPSRHRLDHRSDRPDHPGPAVALQSPRTLQCHRPQASSASCCTEPPGSGLAGAGGGISRCLHMCGISGLSNCAASAGRWRGIAHALNMSEGGVNRVITRIATVERPEQQPTQREGPSEDW